MKKKLTKLAMGTILALTSCSRSPIEGTWQYDGGIYNGRKQESSPDFKMQRTYEGDKYEAYVIDGESEPELYNSGVYEIKGDTLIVTSKYSSRPSQTTDVSIGYKYKIENSRMTTNGTLPNGMIVEEYWKKLE